MTEENEDQIGDDEELTKEDKNDEEMEDIPEKIASVKVALQSSPDDYDLRIELIRLLRKDGELEPLREQRQVMSEKFLMPPDFWLDWIQDEIQCQDEEEEIKKLFSKACENFLSPEVYLEFAQWACGISISYAEEVMEEAVCKIGLRPDCAFLIWGAYIDLESKVKGEEKTEISKLYARLLRIPHVNMETSWDKYCAFAGKDGNDELEKEYKKALELMHQMEDLETRLKSSVTFEEKLSVLYDCVEHEKKGGDPARIQMAYERALLESASAPDLNLWLSYGAWLDFELKNPTVAVDVYSRALRHSPCAALWQQYFTALERANETNIIDLRFNEALESIVSLEEGFSLYRTYIYSLRRRAVNESSSSDTVDYGRVLNVFNEGAEFLQSKFGTYWDSPKAEYRKIHAHFLYTVAKLPDKAYKIWNDILASGSGHMASAWIEAANLERYFGSVNLARKLLYKAINSASDHPHLAFQALIQFEREVGTLSELDKALKKVNAQATRVAARPQKKKDKNEFEKKGEKTQEKKFKQFKSAEVGQNAEVKKLGSGKRNIEEFDEKMAESSNLATKRSKFVDKDGFAVPQLPVPSTLSGTNEKTQVSDGGLSVEGQSGNANVVFISNLDFKLPREKVMEVFPEAKDVRLVYRGMSKLHKGFGYVDFENPDDAANALTKDRILIDGRPMYVSEYKPHEKGERSEFRYAVGLEKNKVFVNNVHYDATPEQIKDIFAGFGAVKDVRIVTHKSGKSKGCAYVEFEDEKAAKAAIDAEDVILLERKLTVALSNPPKKQATARVPVSTPHQRNKIDLVPRIVSKTKRVPNTSGKSNLALPSSGKVDEVIPGNKTEAEKPKGKLSNDEFRKFL